jgi:hypothetical protein
MNLRFQAHLALESDFNFRLISGLENAGSEGFLMIRTTVAAPDCGPPILAALGL